MTTSLAGPIPDADTTRSFIYAAVFDSDDDPANDWVYVPPYDTPMVLLGMVLAAGALRGSSRDAMPRAVQILLVLLYVVPWIPPIPIVGNQTLYLYTPVLVGLGVYQIREAVSATARRGPTPAHEAFAPK